MIFGNVEVEEILDIFRYFIFIEIVGFEIEYFY